MEIVSGILRGMPLRSPSGLTARPTAVRARQALFDSLGELDGLAVADLFAGTGAVGLEAASRGAASVLFVDAQKSSCNTIKANCAKAETIAETAGFEILSGTLPLCCKRLAAHAKPDLIFADPPYAESMGLLAGIDLGSSFEQRRTHAPASALEAGNDPRIRRRKISFSAAESRSMTGMVSRPGIS